MVLLDADEEHTAAVHEEAAMVAVPHFTSGWADREARQERVRARAAQRELRRKERAVDRAFRNFVRGR